MSHEVIGEFLDAADLIFLPGDGVDATGRIKRIFVTQVPFLQVDQQDGIPERQVFEPLGYDGLYLERQGLPVARVVGDHLETDIL